MCKNFFPIIIYFNQFYCFVRDGIVFPMDVILGILIHVFVLMYKLKYRFLLHRRNKKKNRLRDILPREIPIYILRIDNTSPLFLVSMKSRNLPGTPGTPGTVWENDTEVKV